MSLQDSHQMQQLQQLNLMKSQNSSHSLFMAQFMGTFTNGSLLRCVTSVHYKNDVLFWATSAGTEIAYEFALLQASLVCQE